jgi:hypothetical protein
VLPEHPLHITLAGEDFHIQAHWPKAKNIDQGSPLKNARGQTTQYWIARPAILTVAGASVENFFDGISITAPGFAGTLLVKDTAQLAMLQTHDPMTALQHVALPREP